MDLFKELGNALRPENSRVALLKAKIEALDEKNFKPIGNSDCLYIDLEAIASDSTYLIEDVYIGDLNDLYYEADTPEHIKDNNEWQYENSFIKQYFLDHLELIQIINE